MDAVGAIDIGVARRPEHGAVARGGAAESVRGRVVAIVGLGLDDDPAGLAHRKAGADQVGGDVRGFAGKELERQGRYGITRPRANDPAGLPGSGTGGGQMQFSPTGRPWAKVQMIWRWLNGNTASQWKPGRL